jgi:hypothetical protein
MIRAALLVVVVICGRVGPSAAELGAADLGLARQVTQRSWLDMRLQLLGLGLSYPAYRVSVALTDSNQIRFEFWLSTPMASHLSDAGRKETERILAYHAEGIEKQVGDLLRGDFSVLWPRYDPGRDLVGEFMTPAKELEEPPEHWARWGADGLEWNW